MTTVLKGKIEKLDDFVLNTGEVDSFYVGNSKDYVFKLNNGKFDFSASKNHSIISK